MQSSYILEVIFLYGTGFIKIAVVWCTVRGEPVEVEKPPVEVQDFSTITDRFRGIYRGIYLKYPEYSRIRNFHIIYAGGIGLITV